MDIRPIRSQRDHAQALREVERLWGARSGTPEADKLEILVTLIDAYEAKHHPIDPPDPIDAIRFRMEQMGLTRSDNHKRCSLRDLPKVLPSISCAPMKTGLTHSATP